MAGKDPSPPERRASRPRRLGRWAIVLWFCALVGLPLVLLLAGLRPPQIEKRRPAEAPGFFAGALLDSAWYAQIGAWFSDRLPGRDRAIEADARLDLNLFGESPNSRVLLGAGGWLFLRDEIAVPCYAATRVQAAVDEIALVERVLHLAGKDLLLLVAPNKSAIYPDRLGDLEDDAACAVANRVAFRELLAAAGIVGYVDTWSVLESAAATAGERTVYYHLDTHWNNYGAGAVAAAAVERLAPGLWEPASFVLMGTERRIGDLGELMGLPLREDVELWEVHRGEEPTTSTETLARGLRAVVSTVADAPSVGGSAFMIHDSMGFRLAPLLRPYFASLTTVRPRGASESFGTDRAWFGERLLGSDLLIVVTVERSTIPRLQGALLADVVGALAEVLPHREIGLSRRMTGDELGTRWAGSTAEIVTTGSAESRIPVSLPEPPPGTARYLVVRLTPKSRTAVSLTWQDPAGGPPGELVDTVPAEAVTAVFDLSAVGAATELELHLGRAQGRRVSQLLVVEIPPG